MSHKECTIPVNPPIGRESDNIASGARSPTRCLLPSLLSWSVESCVDASTHPPKLLVGACQHNRGLVHRVKKITLPNDLS